MKRRTHFFPKILTKHSVLVGFALTEFFAQIMLWYSMPNVYAGYTTLSFDFERTWWRLFQKRIVCIIITIFITNPHSWIIRRVLHVEQELPTLFLRSQCKSGYSVYYIDFIPLLIRRLKGKLLWLSDVQWYCRLWRLHAAKWTICIWIINRITTLALWP
jgi:hypothetical protein